MSTRECFITLFILYLLPLVQTLFLSVDLMPCHKPTSQKLKLLDEDIFYYFKVYIYVSNKNYLSKGVPCTMQLLF